MPPIRFRYAMVSAARSLCFALAVMLSCVTGNARAQGIDVYARLGGLQITAAPLLPGADASYDEFYRELHVQGGGCDYMCTMEVHTRYTILPNPLSLDVTISHSRVTAEVLNDLAGTLAVHRPDGPGTGSAGASGFILLAIVVTPMTQLSVTMPVQFDLAAAAADELFQSSGNWRLHLSRGTYEIDDSIEVGEHDADMAKTLRVTYRNETASPVSLYTYADGGVSLAPIAPSVPEPHAWQMAGAGLLVCAAWGRRLRPRRHAVRRIPVPHRPLRQWLWLAALAGSSVGGVTHARDIAAHVEFGAISVTIDGQTATGGGLRPYSLARADACDATRDDCVIRILEHLVPPIDDTVTSGQASAHMMLNGPLGGGRQEATITSGLPGTRWASSSFELPWIVEPLLPWSVATITIPVSVRLEGMRPGETGLSGEADVSAVAFGSGPGQMQQLRVQSYWGPSAREDTWSFTFLNTNSTPAAVGFELRTYAGVLIEPVPEPAQWLILSVGLLCMLVRSHRLLPPLFRMRRRWPQVELQSGLPQRCGGTNINPATVPGGCR